MANRNNVYIGNRYVPVFADPVEWDNLRIYEPLTIVTHQGTSYTSKKTVPAGIALSNTEYWVATGNYNAQVEQYRQDVEQYRQDVTQVSSDLADEIVDRENGDTSTLNAAKQYTDNHAGVNLFEGKRVVIFGDSLSATMNSYWGKVQTKVPSMTITNHAASGAAMADCVSLINNETLSNYDVVVVAMGTNNWQANQSLQSFILDTRNVITAIQSQNADIIPIFIAPPFGYNNKDLHGAKNNLGLATRDYANELVNFCSKFSIPCINLSDVCCINELNYTHFLQADYDPAIYLHPNAHGQYLISEVVANCIISSGTQFTYGVVPLTSGNALVYVKTPSTVTISTFGAVPASDLAGLQLPKEIIPPYNVFAACVVNMATYGFISIDTTGDLEPHGHSTGTDRYDFSFNYIISNTY